MTIFARAQQNGEKVSTMPITQKLNPVLFPVIVLLLLSGLTGCAVNKGKSEPLCSTSKEKGLEPGLGVLYFKGFYRHVMEMPHGRAAQIHGRPGKSILMLNHRFGKGEVFDSGRSRGVGVQMSGFINFSVPGPYVFMARSNDGVRVYINGEVIVKDEDVHSERDSEPGTIEIKKPCWYPIEVKYFQRKGTATIELYWKEPGASRFTVVPAEAYAHMPRP